MELITDFKSLSKAAKRPSETGKEIKPRRRRKRREARANYGLNSRTEC